MSGNIHDTNVELLREEVDKMVLQVKEGEQNITFLQKEFNVLYNTSKTLFNFIYKNASKDSFNEKFFKNTIDKMFDEIIKIQQAKISQFDASAKIGETLAQEYIMKKLN